MPAPICLFVYNRPWHTKQTLDALAANELARDSDLIIFSDGPKNPARSELVREVRNLIGGVRGFRSIQVMSRDKNLGLARSVIEGVSEVLGNNESIIVLEDDLVTSPYFLQYMNSALGLYHSASQVISIHAYIYPVRQRLPETFFIRGADCWGWATWQRGWAHFVHDGQKLLSELRQKKLTYSFDFDGAFGFTRMLQKQIEGKNDSWAIRWYASAFLKDLLTLYPGRSLVRNIGNEGSGTHSWDESRYDVHAAHAPVIPSGIEILENLEVRRIISRYLRNSEPSLFRKLLNRINLA
jgi:hypothetical protein